MGQVLGFAHCKEAPSTASTTPDSTEGGTEDFPPLPPPPEEEEEDEDDDEDEDEDEAHPRPPRDDPSPRELTFSYIALGPPQAEAGPPPPPGRARRDPRRGGRAPPPPPPPQPRLSPPRRGPDPPRTTPTTRAPRKRPRDPPHPPTQGSSEAGGAPGGSGEEEEMEETPGRLGAPAPLPPPPPGGAPRPPPSPQPPPASATPPPPADQSASAAGADGQVWELLCWRAPWRSALALLLSLLALGSLSRFSAISVLAHGALAVLAVTFPLRLQRLALGLLRPGGDTQPPARAEVAVPVLSPEQQRRWARCLARHAVTATRTLTRLVLVHSVPESLKFAFLFYLLTYVGAACNGLTLLAAGVVCAFTFPVLYRRHQAQIQQYLSLARSHLSHLRARVLAKLPSAKVKPQ